MDLPADNQPRLINRSIDVNLLGTIATPAQRVFNQVDLLMACTVDRAPWLALVAAVAVGVTGALGLGFLQQLFGTQPAWLLNAMEDRLGPTPLFLLAKLLPLLASAPLALWHLRTWWATSTEAFRHLWPVGDAPRTAPSAVSATCALAVCVRFLTMATAIASAAACGLSSPLWIVIPTLLSLAPLAAAVAPASNATSPSSSASSSSPAAPQQHAASSSAPTSAPGVAAATPLLLPVLASDFAALAAAVLWTSGAPTALAAAAAPGLILGGALAAMTLQPQNAKRWDSRRASVNDAAEVHITVYTDFGSRLDTSVGKRPLQVTVGSAIDNFATQRLGSELAAQVHGVTAADASASTSSTSSSQQRGQQAGSSTSSWYDEDEGTGPSPAPLDPLSPEVAKGTMRFCTPVFGAMLDAMLPGMLVGERARVQLHNPPLYAGGFVNPDLIWWQPLAEVQEKFKAGGMPTPGQVFWFPLGPGPEENQVPVRVNAVSEDFVELDGNDHIEDGQMVVEVQLVSLQKP